MTKPEMTSLQRVLTTLGHKEPDRVPFFLPVTMHGAKELRLSIKEYFSKAENVAEGQLRMRAKFRHDCIYAFFYAPVEIEAMGGEVIYSTEGPPNSGRPFIRKAEDISNLKPLKVKDTACLTKVLTAIKLLKSRVGDEAPVIGVVMSPFSLPVMQMGFDKYIELIFEQEDLFLSLMRYNMDFCVEYANAQLEAGATAIVYFDPVSSSTIIPPAMYPKTGFEIARQTISRIKGPVGTHFASGRCLPIINETAKTGTVIASASALENLAEMKAACRGKLTVIGNLNGIEMRRWTPAQAEDVVRDAISKAGKGGGYILSDNHGEIPWQVPEEALLSISDAVHKWGRYPLEWIK